MSIPSPWTFTPFPPLPATFLPNIAIYNATNTLNNLTYQITLSYPFEWGGPTIADLPANLTSRETLTLYVTDGNALALTAAENLKRRKPVDSSQPDTVVVSIGYPFTDRVYDLSRRGYDFRPPYPSDLLGPEPAGTPPSGADAFIEFINGTLRPWVRREVFPGGGGRVKFTRDCLYGHSFGGAFVVYALAKDPGLFDTFVAASPGLYLYNGSILDVVAKGLGGKVVVDEKALLGPGHLVVGSVGGNNGSVGGEREGKGKKPAVFIGYGSGEQFPKRRRTGETEEEFWTRRNFLNPLKMTDYVHDLYDLLVGSGRLRDVVVKEYADQDHAAVAASAIGDGGISYFLDW